MFTDGKYVIHGTQYRIQVQKAIDGCVVFTFSRIPFVLLQPFVHNMHTSYIQLQPSGPRTTSCRSPDHFHVRRRRRLIIGLLLLRYYRIRYSNNDMYIIIYVSACVYYA